jgi:hypothetical protein
VSHTIFPQTPDTPLGTLASRMGRREFLRLGAIGAAGATMAGMAVFRSGDADARPNGSVALGAFAPSLPWDFRDIDDFSSLVGSKPAIVHWFQDWVMDFDPAYMDEAISRGGMPLVTWEPWEFDAGPDQLDQPRYTLKKILDGKHDAYVSSWAKAAASWGKPFFLRFAHEMNGDWTTWSPGVGLNTARDFVSVWRRVHGIFRQEGATNVRWVWSPVAQYEGSVPYKHVYPGDAYVHWFGISGYNWGNTLEWSRWQSFSEIFGASYATMTRMARKPVMIPEVGCAEHGGDKAAWIRSAYLEEIPKKFPKIKAVSWFHVKKENDWRVDSSATALQAYQRVAASSLYQRRLL